ncbi:xanthine permease [Caproiciproducens galactitolivorans]|uniref:Uracil permease n=1 Tax=Caproiciproducens galactitolivorans TaxID=642589 RepID=A0A4Z0Y9L7_9FIRM|nr:solute carrier family 23 protein [Caproiciproducens galactitolivorans]QEY35115.1 xanthine permease [Caproiciproducens galactitolivorans]TGJ76658.1 uracil permease [Caproiciproducens galactitolivorans]
MSTKQTVTGYLPDERPPFFKLLLFAFQQIIVMFPATVLVALLTGFHVSTTIFASGLATIGFILITGRQIPLFYGSSFSYITAICSITGAKAFAGPVADDKIAAAQFGIVLSGLVSIAAGLIIKQFGQEAIEKVLPATITGSIALVIGLSLAGTALGDPVNLPNGVSEASKALALNLSWTICIVTLLATILFSVYLKGTWGQIPILLGLLTGYVLALILGAVNHIPFCDFNKIPETQTLFSIPAIGFALPHFTLPKADWAAVAAIMPIAIATIPESTAHLYQLDIYVNNLARRKGSDKKYPISDKLGLNLVGDGLGDMISALIGGPAGTNYGENLSTMAITNNFSTPMLITAAIITMIISCFTPLTAAVYSIPNAVIGGISIYLFGVIASQGITIMISKKVDMFDSRNLAVIATVLIIGIGGSFAFSDGMIPMFGAKFPAIATAAIFGILLNLLLNIGRPKPEAQSED